MHWSFSLLGAGVVAHLLELRVIDATGLLLLGRGGAAHPLFRMDAIPLEVNDSLLVIALCTCATMTVGITVTGDTFSRQPVP